MPKARILVVDDSKIVLTGFRGILEEAGYEVETAQSGKEAVEKVKSRDFDIVYTDMLMPGMNGSELCEEVKKISSKTPVVLFSGSPQGVANHQTNFIISGGTEKFLRKPLSKNEILHVTKEVLREQHEKNK